MTRSARLLVLPLALVTIFGAGCGQRPVVVQAPPIEMPATTTSDTTAPPAATPTSGWNPIVDTATSSVMAYVSLNGGSATVQRDGEAVAATDNEELASGDRVTVTAGTVSVIYPNAGETRLETGSDATIVSDSTSTSVFAELRLSAGRAWTRFERLLGNDEHFSVAANGVVATVRGTAFGVSIDGDQADVQVADHFVDLSQEGKEVQGVRIEAGEAMKMRASDFVGADMPLLRTHIRKMTVLEQATAGYRFAMQPLTAARLRVPAQVVRPFRVAPIVRPEMINRLRTLRSVLMPSGFIAPNRGLLNTEVQPITTTPSATGPAIK